MREGLARARSDSQDGYGWHDREGHDRDIDHHTEHVCAEPALVAEPPRGTGDDGDGVGRENPPWE